MNAAEAVSFHFLITLTFINIIVMCYILGSYKPIICPSGDLNAATLP